MRKILSCHGLNKPTNIPATEDPRGQNGYRGLGGRGFGRAQYLCTGMNSHRSEELARTAALMRIGRGIRETRKTSRGDARIAAGRTSRSQTRIRIHPGRDTQRRATLSGRSSATGVTHTTRTQGNPRSLHPNGAVLRSRYSDHVGNCCN